MEAEKKNRQIANAYYNLGLQKAKQRDLTGAIAALKRCLRFDKFQMDGRNLLGLIYFEVGETAAALTQWVISLNLQGTDNLAEEYINGMYEAPGYLEQADQAIKKYNQSLAYAQNDNEDLAVLLLMRMLDEFPHYVRAQMLLALLYIKQEDYIKAGRCLYQALKIDKFNPTAQRYMEIAKRNTGRADVEKRKLKNAFSHRQMQDDDIIIPPSYKENTGWQSIINILVGLVLGAMVIFFLVLPARTEHLNVLHNGELTEKLEIINQKSIEIDTLQKQIATAKASQEAAESQLSELVNENGGVLSQYQNLARILQCYREDDMRNAALLYVATDVNVLRDGVLNAIVDWVSQDMEANGYQVLMTMADEAMNQENGAGQAIDYYQKSLMIRPENPEVIYKLGLAYQAQGDVDTANQYYGDVIMNYSSSEFAERAKTQRGY